LFLKNGGDGFDVVACSESLINRAASRDRTSRTRRVREYGAVPVPLQLRATSETDGRPAGEHRLNPFRDGRLRY
jgi:hypothetical protein